VTAAPEHTDHTPTAEVVNLPAVREQALPVAIGPPSATEWVALREQSQALAASRIVPSNLYGRADDVLLIVMAGRELAVPPVMALSRIHVVEGKPTLSAELMRALVLRAGHHLHVEKSTDTEVTIVGWRKGEQDYPSRVTWSMARAKTAGLAGKGNLVEVPAADDAGPGDLRTVPGDLRRRADGHVVHPRGLRHRHRRRRQRH
jgi:hypothetical protein